MRGIIRISSCAVIALCATAVILARTTALQTSASQPPNTPSAKQKVVVTGCLMEGPSSATPAAGAAIGSPSDTMPGPKYVLTNATAAPADDNDAPGPTGTTGATGGTKGTAGASTTPAQTYRLVANVSALTPHVGKKLELTGTLEPAGSGGSEASTGADANANSPVLRVQAGKVVAASCSE